MKYLLVVFFMSPEGDWSFINGFLPLKADTHEKCESMKVRTEEYFSKVGGIPEYRINCYKVVPEGSDA